METLDILTYGSPSLRHPPTEEEVWRKISWRQMMVKVH